MGKVGRGGHPGLTKKQHQSLAVFFTIEKWKFLWAVFEMVLAGEGINNNYCTNSLVSF